MAGLMAHDLSPSTSNDFMANDPFAATPQPPPHLRFSALDTSAFSLGPGASADQARRALEAHLADTDRRMEEAGKLGTALLQQRKQLTDRLKEVEQLQSEAELSPELRERLAEIERDYNEVARESARASLPRQRVPSNEAAAGSPFALEGKGGKRSVSPSKFESQATGSPTKLSVPNRKLRNQPANRIHDIEFAAEISTSLISQVRNLQALLAGREEELRDTKAENSRLEIEAEAIQQRIKTLDESEHRYKDENWNLETQIHDLIAAQKEAADREKRLNQSLNILQADKNSTQRELDEVRLNLSRLDEKHTASIKQHDIEMGTLKRKEAMAESEKAAMQRKIEDLTGQNQELARAFSAQRGRTLEHEALAAMADEDFGTGREAPTPEHSPPPSPMKNTPRHSMLESETLKTSLQHAQRTIQSLRTNVHREKTEKLELKRMLQDARDELEKTRNDPAPVSRRARKTDPREQRKPLRLGQLGVPRTSKSEIYFDDPAWEDEVDMASHRSSSVAASPASRRPPNLEPLAESGSDHFETANETSDAAFETAHERGTETEDFHTGAEEFSDDDDAATETEDSPCKGVRRTGRSPINPLGRDGGRYSFDSTASTSNDEDDYSFSSRPKTPRRRGSRSTVSRRSRRPSEEPALQSSPVSSTRRASSTLQTPCQSLFAELGEAEGSDDGSYVGPLTPSRRSIRSLASGSMRGWAASPPPEVPALPKPIMVDSGMMTEPVGFVGSATVGSNVPSSDGYRSAVETLVFSPPHATTQEPTRPLSAPHSDTSAQHDPEIRDKLAQFPVPPRTPSKPVLAPASSPAPKHSLSISGIQSEYIEPQPGAESPPPAPPALGISALVSQELEPLAEEPPPSPALAISSALLSEEVEPVAEEPAMTALPLDMSTILISLEVEPLAEKPPPPPALTLTSAVLTGEVAPVAEESATVLPLDMSRLISVEVEPVAEEPILPPALTLSSAALVGEVVPIAEEAAPTLPLDMSSVLTSMEVEPMSEELAPPPPLTISSVVVSEDVEPCAEEPPALAPLVMTSIMFEQVAPSAPEAQPGASPSLAFSPIISEHMEPAAAMEPPSAPPVLSVTQPLTKEVEPVIVGPAESLVDPSAELLPALSLSPVHAQQVEPIPEAKVAVPSPAQLALSTLQTEAIEPVQVPLSFSGTRSETVEPEVARSVQEPLCFSAVHAETIRPEPTKTIQPETLPVVSPILAYSGIRFVENEPIEPRSPKREAFIIPRDTDIGGWLDSELSQIPQGARFSSTPKPHRSRGESKALESPVIAEDDTCQSVHGSPTAETSGPNVPLQELSSNDKNRPARKDVGRTTDQSAQTSLTSDAIDKILTARPLQHGHENKDPSGNVGTPSTVVRRRKSRDSVESALPRVKMADAGSDVFSDAAPRRRPSSSGSTRPSFTVMPPLPVNHRENIEAARSGSSNGGSGSMGPPLFPASAYRNQNPLLRPQTPSSVKPRSPDSLVSGRHTLTPRPARLGSAHGTQPSRKSSVSSFMSELDSRFNMQNSMGMNPGGFGSNTDPRMIQAITQTMIGEYLWKYTRKTGRGGLSENRHRRYFWVHPYTRTLYWSDRDPSGGRSELRAKSVPIEAVRVVTDDNPMPPGLHRKSLVVLSTGRTIKFTCTTGQRHETWFNALSYLLLRTGEEGQVDAEEMAGSITREDVDEFDPTPDRRHANGTRLRALPSLSSYSSRTTRNESPAMGASMNIPTLTPSPQVKTSQSRPSLGTFSRISGYWKDNRIVSGTFSSLRSRSVNDHSPGTYETSEAHDSAEDLRRIIERQDRESDRMENVRACCDGKHDVGALPHSTKKNRHSHLHPQAHRTSSTTSPTPVGTLRSKA